ncbi:MAG: hypothetical protein K2I63_00975 [Helicobacter sp.]|nr:hypothetical protein [Helicobacter sp.]
MMKQTLESKEKLPSICEYLSAKEREVAQIQKDFQNRKFARYLFKNIGNSYEGIIIHQSSPPIASLVDYPIMSARVTCLGGSGIKYQRVRVQIVEVNLATARIYGKIIETLEEDRKLPYYFFLKKQEEKILQRQKESQKMVKPYKNTIKAKANVPKRTRRKIK